MTHRALVKTGLRWLYWGHRWFGIATCLLVLLWFASGLVMMYVPYPSLTDAERLAALAPIDWKRVKVGPNEALHLAKQTSFPGELRLEMAAGEPVWRMRKGDARIALSAWDGQLRASPDFASAGAAARHFSGGAPIRHIERIHDDQWTVAPGFKWARPLWKVSMADARGTQLYVSSANGEVVQDTTARERAWNWMGAVPHWLYLTAIRREGAVWRQVVLWTSGPAILGGLSGMWIGILRIRLRRRYRSGSVSPYRGWMKWHHIAGLVGGIFALTWVTSGWLSVNPFDWFARDAPSGGAALYAGHDGADFPALRIGALTGRMGQAREARFTWVGGRPAITMTAADGQQVVVDPEGRALRFGQEELVINARRLMPATAICRTVILSEPDVYWYSHGRDRPIPAIRVIFADQDETWVTIDPRTGALLARQNASGRTYRWLFNAFHEFDLPWLLANRMVRDPVMWAFSGLGILMSLSGIVIGWRHLARRYRRNVSRL